MLEFITSEPESDADKERGHAIPFHSDMIFQFNKAAINDQFFKTETMKELVVNLDLIPDEEEKVSSPQQMIDVYMTPTQSDEEFSEESISP